MRRDHRNCRTCGRRALTPKSPGKAMRGGWIFRKGHDLCQRCYRSALAAGRRTPPRPMPQPAIGVERAA